MPSEARDLHPLDAFATLQGHLIRRACQVSTAIVAEALPAQRRDTLRRADPALQRVKQRLMPPPGAKDGDLLTRLLAQPADAQADPGEPSAR